MGIGVEQLVNTPVNRFRVNAAAFIIFGDDEHGLFDVIVHPLRLDLAEIEGCVQRQELDLL